MQTQGFNPLAMVPGATPPVSIDDKAVSFDAPPTTKTLVSLTKVTPSVS